MAEKANPSRILITGFAGFVGSYLAKRCRTHFPQAKLFGLYNRATSLPTADAAAYITTLQVDITKANELRAALAHTQPDLIFHLAAQSSVTLSWSDPVRTLEVNTLATLHLLETLRQQHSLTRIVLIGSGEQYGIVQMHENPISEDHPLKPTNPYAVSKAAQDLYGYQYFTAYGLPVIRIRAFNHFGPHQPDTFVIANFARQIALIEAGKTAPVIKVGNLQAKRDFLPVEDVVAAYIAVAERGHTGEAYNVGSGKARPIKEILDYLLSCARVPIQVIEDPARMRPVDIPVLEAAISRIQAHTGWLPIKPFESALDATLDYWRSQEPIPLNRTG